MSQNEPDRGSGGAAARPEATWAGTVEGFTFRAADTGFAVVRLRPDDGGTSLRAVGTLAQLSEGQRVRLHGKVVEHPRFGRQLEVAEAEVETPKTRAGVIAYLSSGLVKGVGPTTAARLVDHFGEHTLEVIERQPERLREVKGLGSKRAAELVAKVHEQRDVQEVMVFLRTHGLGTAMATRIFQRYGRGAAALIQADPYRLADEVVGVGFRRADQLAHSLGITGAAPERVRAGVLFALANAGRDGHCFLPQDDLVAQTSRLLAVDDADVTRAVGELAAERRVAVEALPERPDPAVYPLALHRAELGCAYRLGALIAGLPAPLPFDAEPKVREFARGSGMALPEGQLQALVQALAHPVSVVTGGPGVGKTTIVRTLVAILAAHGLRVLLAAPTGRAAKRLEEATSHPATTLHRVLEYQPGINRFRRDERLPLAGDLLVVDETSMLDIGLAHALVRAVPDGMRLVFVGDIDQLPAVGPGSFLRDLTACGRVPVTRLQQVFRQGDGSLIVDRAHRILAGEVPETGGGGSDFHVVTAQDGTHARALVVEMVSHRIPKAFGLDPLTDVQVLVPMYRGEAGADALNAELQRRLNPDGAELSRRGRDFRVGDKVMQVRNDHEREVYNGDVGRISASDPAGAGIVVRFGDRLLSYRHAELDDLVPAYAITVHRAQGSEYPAVVLPLLNEHFPMLQRHLLYTAVTRGKKLVVVVAQPRALELAVDRGEAAHRWSGLARRLTAARP